MIWRKHRVLTCLCALFALCLVSSVFMHSSVSALDTGWVTRTSTDVEHVVRTAWGTSTIQDVTNAGTQNLPWLALGANDGSNYVRPLWGMLLYNDMTSYNANIQYEDYSTISVTFNIHGLSGRDLGEVTESDLTEPSSEYNILLGNRVTLIVYDDHNLNKEVTCFGSVTTYNVDFTCTSQLEPGHKPIGYHIRIKPYDNLSQLNALNSNFYLLPNSSKNVGINFIKQKIVTDSDPLKGLLRQGNVISENIYNSVDDIYSITNNYYNAQAQQDAQDRNAVQGASDNATAQGDSASANAQNATSSLLGAITSIYGVLLHPTSTNCNIGPINFYNQLNLGTLDMCTFNTPQPLMAIGALICIGLVILLAWSVLHATMSLYKDLFGGGK